MRVLLLNLLAVALVSCSTATKTKEALSQQDPSVSSQKISVMTFNVENLFDLEDDPNKNDDAFLPLEKKTNEVFQNKCRAQNLSYKDKKADQDESNGDPDGSDKVAASDTSAYHGFRVDECLGKNYSAKILDRKMNRMTDVVAQINNGQGPDILFLQEVENEPIVTAWRDKYLSKMGYQTLLFIEGPDERGIDVAILSKLPRIGQPKYHNIDFSKVPEIPNSDTKPTRGILEGQLQLPNGELLNVFAVHFPSQGASSNHRKAGLLTLLDVTQKVKGQVIVGGDFNITSTEDWKKKYYEGIVSSRFTVSHLAGCKGCPGSTYYSRDATWSFFDVLLFSKNLSEPGQAWQLDPTSIRLANKSVYQIGHDGKPAKFRNGLGSVGVSDHWPMYAEIFLKTQTPTATTVGAKR